MRSIYDLYLFLFEQDFYFPSAIFTFLGIESKIHQLGNGSVVWGRKTPIREWRNRKAVLVKSLRRPVSTSRRSIPNAIFYFSPLATSAQCGREYTHLNIPLHVKYRKENEILCGDPLSQVIIGRMRRNISYSVALCIQRGSPRVDFMEFFMIFHNNEHISVTMW